jgi:hypothetical protein
MWQLMQAAALQAALAMSMDVSAPSSTAAAPASESTLAVTKAGAAGIGLPAEFKGNYELYAVVTHQVSFHARRLNYIAAPITADVIITLSHARG